MKKALITVSLLLISGLLWSQSEMAQREAEFYQLADIEIPEGIELEVGGMDVLPDGRLAVCTRRGEIWLVSGLYQGETPDFKLFARGLHEPLGLTYHEGSIYCAQRGELSKITDTNGDDWADTFETIYQWPLTANYHEYAYGPLFLPDGSMLIQLNVGWEKGGVSKAKWRGWMLKISPDGKMTPFACGMRSPAGLGFDAEGNVFYSENQGDWVGSGRVTHVEEGDFVGHAASLAWADEPNSPVKVRLSDIEGKSYGTLYNAAKEVEGIKPPAVWFPHGIMGISTAAILTDNTNGKFGPFAGDVLVSDQGQSKIMRMQLEKVYGVYQGAVFPFREGFASGLLRLNFGKDGVLFGGMTSRGWASTGPKMFALQRLQWTGKTPFEMKAIHIKGDGFEVEFTKPVTKEQAEEASNYQIQGFTYHYHKTYGSPAIDMMDCPVKSATLSEDGKTVKLVVDGLRAGFVHEMKLKNLTSAEGDPMLHDVGYYTINRIPGGKEFTGDMQMVASADGSMTLSPKRQVKMPETWDGVAEQEITITTVPGMKYDQKLIEVKAGTKLQLNLHNPDDMQHNLVIIEPGSLDEVAKAAIDLGLEGPGKGYIPSSEKVLYHTSLLGPETEETIYLQVPDKPGDYIFVCTVPGHAQSMNGVLRVLPKS